MSEVAGAPDLEAATDVWFSGQVDGGPEADAFLERVRELAPDALGWRLEPDDTAAYGYGCLIAVEVPGVPASEVPVYTHQLQVLWEPDHLGGYWGCSHLWDGYDPAQPGALDVPGSLSPIEAGERALIWLQEQLSRPVVVEEWDARLSPVPVRRWVLADTDEYIAGKRRRPRRRAPDRVTPVWPPSS